MKGDAGKRPAPIELEQVILLWAFAEVALGGMLHAFRLPFTGLLVGSVSILCLCLLGTCTGRSREILRALAIVLAVKAAVTPHAPVGAFLAVGFQGLTAWLLFRLIPLKGLACLLLGILALGQSALQKVLFMTLLYGMPLWQAVDLLAATALGFFGLEVAPGVNPSHWIVALYILIHLLAGALVGLAGSRLPEWIHEGSRDPDLPGVIAAANRHQNLDTFPNPARSRKRRLLKRAAGLLLAACLIGILVGLDRQSTGGPAQEAIFVLLRVISVALVYLFLIAPVLRRGIGLFAKREKEAQSGRFTRILKSLPRLRPMAMEAWAVTRGGPGMRPIRAAKVFLAAILIPASENKGEASPSRG